VHNSGGDEISIIAGGRGFMEDVENTLKALERARRRRKELKSLLGVLFKEYKLVKKEIKLHEERLEKWMSAKEYAAYLDTIDMDGPPEFPILSDEKGSTDKK
jgi:hypothetical protein